MSTLTLGLTVPVIGTEYELYLGIGDSGIAEQVNAVYLGHNTSKTPWYTEISSPEGHIFGRHSPDKNLEIYCSRGNEKALKEMWLSDGEDGPEWPVGFGAEIFTGDVSSTEREVILERINWRML